MSKMQSKLETRLTMLGTNQKDIRNVRDQIW
jgi:hypothetical protein